MDSFPMIFYHVDPYSGKEPKYIMTLNQCPRCKSFFYRISEETTCPECTEILEDQFRKITEYLQGKHHGNVREAAAVCGMEISQVKQWIREKRMELAEEDDSVQVTCEHCGVPIRSGRLCGKCEQDKKRIVHDLSDAFRRGHTPAQEQPDTHVAGRMRFIRRR